jgi:hypothetical protein
MTLETEENSTVVNSTDPNQLNTYSAQLELYFRTKVDELT